MDQNENPYISYRVDGRKRIEWKEWPKISQARLFVACAKSSTYVTKSNSIPFCGQSRSHENGSVDPNRSMRFRWQGKRISVDRAATNKVGTIIFAKCHELVVNCVNNTRGKSSLILQCRWLQYAILTTTIFFVYLSEFIVYLTQNSSKCKIFSGQKQGHLQNCILY